MPDLVAVFKNLEAKHVGANIAGYVGMANNNKRSFFYEASHNWNLPAAAYIFDRLGRAEDKVYTNLLNHHWLYTWTGSRIYNVQTHLGNTNVAVEQVVELNDKAVKIVAGVGKEGPFKQGGLYAAGLSLSNDGFISYKVDDPKQKLSTQEKGFHRALKYYMLAAYALLGKGISQNYSGGNYICALLVDDTGKILSWGLNNGWFHHGEVNMLLNYFANNPTRSTLPPKTLVFSTLTPCEQCALYLEDVRSAETLVFMGQQDTGPKGSAGEDNAQYLRDLTDPVRVVTRQGLRNGIATYPIDQALSNQMVDRNGTIAKKIGQWCAIELAASFETLHRKKEKPRPRDLEDQQVKVKALTYLAAWLKSVQLQNTNKRVG